MSALLLIAHGSSELPLDAHPIWRHAAALSARGAAKVEVAFLRGEPTIQDALTRLDQPATIVPIFMARGYFVERVLPAALGHPDLTIGATTPDGLLTLGAPIGEHPQLPHIAARAIRAALAEQPAPDTWRVALVGHGTSRHARSGQSAEDAADILRDQLGLIVHVGYLDQEPAIEPVMLASAAPTIILPWMIGGGGHAEQDIPARAAALAAGSPITLDPIGAHPAIAELIAP